MLNWITKTSGRNNTTHTVHITKNLYHSDNALRYRIAFPEDAIKKITKTDYIVYAVNVEEGKDSLFTQTVRVYFKTAGKEGFKLTGCESKKYFRTTKLSDEFLGDFPLKRDKETGLYYIETTKEETL